ncbi:MAG TPA: ABC transporter substrate-binding protein, partial [Chloroflexota bacterium]
QYQWDPAQTRPSELPREVKLRQGMYEAIDRATLREFQFPGVPDTNGDSFIPAADSRGPIVGQPFARYQFDPNQAVAHLQEGGWTRTADGHFLDRSGSPVNIELRAGSPSDQPVVAVLGDMWRKIGIDTTENIVPNTFGSNYGPDVVQWPGLQLTGRGAAEIALSQFQTRQIPRLDNRWTGQNTGSYSNPAMDRLFDQVYATLDANERAGLLKQVGELLAADLPGLPIYWRISFMEVRNTVRGPLVSDHAHMGPDINGYNLSRNAHLWERA